MTLKQISARAALLAAVTGTASLAQAEIIYTGPANGSWYTASNWTDSGGTGTPPPSGTLPSTAATTNINSGVAGGGVVFDPVAQGGTPVYDIARLYIVSNSSGAGNAGFPGTTRLPQTLTINSGTLHVNNDYTIVGRSADGTLLMNGGAFTSDIRIEVGQVNGTSSGNGTIDHRGGDLEVAFNNGGASSSGIRLGVGQSMTGTLISRNVGAGRIHTANYYSAYNAGVAGSPNIGVSEFHYNNGGTRPVQVDGQLSIRNNTAQSSRLSFVVDSAPTVGAGGVPNSVGLFDVDFDGNAGTTDVITGITGQSKNFFSTDGLTELTEGTTISRTFGGNTYNWSLSYTGNITESADGLSVLGVTGAGTGRDVVLVGLSSTVQSPEPASLAMIGGALTLLGRRSRR